MNSIKSFLPSNARLATDTYICEINHETAFDWLKRNENNRTLKLNAAKKIAKSIQLDQWKCNHQAIAFDWNGKLIDGQHRLWAIFKSEKTVSVRVTLNCEPESIKTVDTGTSRSNGDMLTLNGHKNAAKKAAAIKQVINYYEHPNSYWNCSDCSVSALTVENKLEELSAILDFEYIVKFAKSCNQSNPNFIHTVGITFYILAILEGFNPERIELFLNQIATGAKLDIDDIAYRLRRQWEYADKDEYTHAMKSQKKLSELIYCFGLFNKNIKRKKMPEIPATPMPSFQ
jgi:hypothetical protein